VAGSVQDQSDRDDAHLRSLGIKPELRRSLGFLSNFAVAFSYISVSTGTYTLIALGLGFGGPWGVAGAMLHIANHALARSVLFLLSGRIRAAYGSMEIAAIRGLLARLPITGPLFFAAMLALLGLPPFGLFVSEVMIFGAGFAAGQTAVATVALGLVVIAFAGLLRALQRMLYGEAAGRGIEPRAWTAVPLVAALVLLLMTGLAWPPGLAGALSGIAGVIAP